MLDPQLRRGPVDSAAVYTHSRTRTTSSGALPPFQVQAPIPLHVSQGQYPQYQQQYPQQYQQQQPFQQQSYQQQYQQQYQQYPQQQGGMYPPQRRSPSVNTFSTTSTAPPPTYRASPPNDLRRSTSSRSGGSPSQSPSLSYVAALRRQKGTVWCDRAQPEDPHLAAQLRAAKAKASAAVLGGGPRLISASYTGGASGGRTSTGISTTNKVAAKIRHHGKQGIVGYVAGENHVGVGGVPPRLSATEVEGESSGDEERGLHRRTGSSGRSSTASGRRYRTSGGPGSLRRQSATATPDRTMSLAEEVIPPAAVVVPAGRPSDAASAKTHGSGSSAERGDNVAELAHDPNIASISRAAAEAAKEKAGAPGLERRGSVDERTMTLSAGRLYIANPD